MNKLSWADVVYYFICISLVALVCFLASCGTEKKINKAKATLSEHPNALAEICAEKFPVKENTVYISGKTVTDTIYVDATPMIDYVDCPPSDTITRYKVEVKTKIREITKTRTDTVTIVKENTAKLKVETDAKEAALQDRDDWKKRADKNAKFKSWFWLLVTSILIAFGAWCYVRIRAGAITGILNRLK